MAPSAGTTHKGQYGALAAGAVFAAALTYVGFGDPHRSTFLFPVCPFKAMTGLNCPGCGGLRMVHDLLHGDLAAAVVDNVFLLAGLPVLLAWVLVRRKQRKPVMTASAAMVVVAAAATWTVVRNLPGFPLVPTLLAG